MPNEALCTAAMEASSPVISTRLWAWRPYTNMTSSPTAPVTVTDGSACLATIVALPSSGARTMPTGDDLTSRLGHLAQHRVERRGQAGVEFAGLRTAGGTTDVFVVHEELHGVGQLVDRGDLRRRPDRRARAHRVDQVVPLGGGHPGLHLVGVPGGFRHDDADRSVGTALAHHEVSGEIAGGPVATERWCIGADLGEEFTERSPLGLGGVGVHCHWRTVPP